MNRSTLDKLISSTGLIIAIVLLALSGAATYAHSFVHKQVHDQLAAEKIEFPPSGSPAIISLPSSDQAKVAAYAGQQLLNGKQAEVFADHFIAVHLKSIGDSKTYAELSAESLADPSNTALAGKVQTVFRGETLRGLLLNAYAFDTMATVASWVALGSLAAGIVLLILAWLGFVHAKQSNKKRR